MFIVVKNNWKCTTSSGKRKMLAGLKNILHPEIFSRFPKCGFIGFTFVLSFVWSIVEKWCIIDLFGFEFNIYID